MDQMLDEQDAHRAAEVDPAMHNTISDATAIKTSHTSKLPNKSKARTHVLVLRGIELFVTRVSDCFSQHAASIFVVMSCLCLLTIDLGGRQ